MSNAKNIQEYVAKKVISYLSELNDNPILCGCVDYGSTPLYALKDCCGMLHTEYSQCYHCYEILCCCKTDCEKSKRIECLECKQKKIYECPKCRIQSKCWECN